MNTAATRGDAELKKWSENKTRVTRLKGIPVSVKDLIDTKDIVTTYGSSIYSNHIPKKDASVVTNIKKNGGVILCKTNTHEFALGIETPPTKNPWDLSRIPGGSSGGSAAAISADLAIFALGTDTGGSIRIPASMCGITGLKPTYGSISVEGIFPESFSLDHVGPMCRFASDLPLLLESMGYPRKINLTEKKLIVGIEKSFLEQSDDCVRSRINSFVDKCSSEDFIVVREIELPNVDAINNYHAIIDTSEIAYVHRNQYNVNKSKYLATSVEQILMGQKNKVVDYINALKYRGTIINEFNKIYEKIDVIIAPSLPCVAPKIAETKKMTLAELYPYVKFLEIFNYIGFPSISFPCGFCSGLPVGVQLISKPWREDLIISLASRFQSVTDWHTRVPSGFGELII